MINSQHKAENAESFYICKSYTKANGSTTSAIVRKLGTLEQLLPEHGPTRDEVLAWAKNEVKIETEKYKKEKEAQTVLIPFHADRQLDYNKQVFFRGGYLFLQSFYYQLQMNKTCRKLKQKYKFKYDINAILSDLIYARILEPCSKRSSYKVASEFLEKPSCGKRYQPEVVLPVYSRLLYCCGLRPQEPPAIRTEDVDLVTGDVYIRQSKRHKDRHIIMSEDMRALCQKYDYVAGKRQWFFQKWDGTPYETSWYNQVWRNLISKSGISWKGTPRPYDLRHAFASRNIIRWINNGKDVMELLPYLSAYMGHSELTSTLYYIHLLPENLRRSKAIDWDLLSQVYGKGVPEDED